MKSSKTLPACWMRRLSTEFDKNYMHSLNEFLQDQKCQGATIYPKETDVFRAFKATKFEDVKVVLLGQDPYHGPGQAHGLSFSVPDGQKIPPSLRNIYKEIKRDLECDPELARFQSGELGSWASQGVLLLNSVLTVEGGQAGSHKTKKAWCFFCGAVMHKKKQVLSIRANTMCSKHHILVLCRPTADF